jgi:hypothetical protein
LKIFTDISEAEDALAELAGQLGTGQMSRAARMAINDTMRRQRTKLRQFVRKGYNIPADKINSINFKAASDYNLEAKMGASSKPVQLSYFKPVFVGTAFSVRGKYTKKKGFAAKLGKGRANAPGGVTVEIKKGERQTISFAFMVGKFEIPFVFARGSYAKGKGFVTGKPRNPITALSSASTFGAAFGKDRRPKVAEDAEKDLAILAQEYLQKMKDGIIK